MHRMQSGEYASHAARVAKGTEPIRTKTGKVLSNLEIQELADEAERGYDVSKLDKLPYVSFEKYAVKPPPKVKPAKKAKGGAKKSKKGKKGKKHK